eukprot:TRINITY_DN3381_c0_g1_i2.p2 TRINITY_DN3381_c0_g1~~TRINITY_DN3381_c0_g1_i2.p2  ORF type:complete len:153 (-),score=38.56 TRINITY_DN3381_c0_g1_i2:104-562(-)
MNKFIPFAVEPAVGLDRLMLAFLTDAYHEDVVADASRVMLQFHEQIAPYRFAVLPLLRKDAFVKLAGDVHEQLLQTGSSVDFDVTASIGKRYRRQDEIGTPYCITIDGDSLENQTVTVRDRDSTAQIRVPIQELVEEAKRPLVRFFHDAWVK